MNPTSIRLARNYEIRHPIAHYIDATNSSHGMVSIPSLLRTLDLTNYVLLEAHRTERAIKQQLRSKKSNNPAMVTKEFQVTWAISLHDLTYKLKRAKEYLEKGNRVEVVIAGKKGMAKVTRRQCEEVIEEVEKSFEVVKGAREWKAREGELGMQLTMFWQRKVVRGGGGGGGEGEEVTKPEGGEEVTQPEGGEELPNHEGGGDVSGAENGEGEGRELDTRL
ncbi:hypothetical protein BDZ91DRAFT_746559 [Kalaharituber pfeilii]|nr:hypothetical protein BDZ91DRAFT_746559 [Kalaharituber pfeilii]